MNRPWLTWQAAVPSLNAALSRQLPASRIGGIWIAPGDGDRVKIGVVGLAPPIRAIVNRAVRAAGLAAGADLVPVRYSAAQLADADAWLSDQLVTLARTSPVPVQLDSGYRMDLNRVQLGITAGHHLTAAERALVSRARARYGALVQVVSVPSTQAASASCTYPFCSPPLRGGIRILSPNGKIACTSGFIAKSRSDGKLYEFTAGHCAAHGGKGNWVTDFPDHSVHAVGPVHNFTFGGGGDMGILSINNPSGWKLPQGWVYVTADPGVTTLNEQYPITSAQYSTQGARVCKSGAYGATTCGVVTGLGKTITVGGVMVKNLGEASFCSIEGDSGGPVFASHQAFGLETAITVDSHGKPVHPCDSFYQGILGAARAMNVSIVFAH